MHILRRKNKTYILIYSSKYKNYNPVYIIAATFYIWQLKGLFT